MFNRVLAIMAIILALLIAVLGIFLPQDKVGMIIMISRFFEVMIPILAVGGLLKYLTHCSHLKTWNVVLPACTIFLAIIVGFLAVLLPAKEIQYVIVFTRFFELMLPVLVVAGLVKFLSCCGKKNCNV